MNINLYIFDTSVLEEESLYEKYYDMMPGYRKEKIDKKIRKIDKRASLGAGILLYKALVDYISAAGYVTITDSAPLAFGKPPTACMPYDGKRPTDYAPLADAERIFAEVIEILEKVKLGAGGKPYIPNLYDSFRFNLSHSGTKVMCISAYDLKGIRSCENDRNVITKSGTAYSFENIADVAENAAGSAESVAYTAENIPDYVESISDDVDRIADSTEKSADSAVRIANDAGKVSDAIDYFGERLDIKHIILCSDDEKARGKHPASKGSDKLKKLLSKACLNEIDVGCDVQEVTKANMDIARRFYDESEYNLIMSESESELESGQKCGGEGSGSKSRDEMFFRLWTLKESFLKTVGCGLKSALGSFSIDIKTAGEDIVVHQDIDDRIYVFGELDGFEECGESDNRTEIGNRRCRYAWCVAIDTK